MSLREEIREQPQVLQGLLETQSAAVAQVAATIRARGISSVYLAARGTSEHAGIYGQYVLGAFAGLPVALAAPSLFTIYGRPPHLGGALVIGVSQSGQSPDIVAVVKEGRRQGALTLAISNDPGSPLAQAAELTLNVSAGVENAVAATKTYTGELMVLPCWRRSSLVTTNKRRGCAGYRRQCDPSRVGPRLRKRRSASVQCATA